MDKRKRLFIAIELSKELVQQVSLISRRFQMLRGDRSIRWTNLENLHLTLAFLGDTPVEAIPAIKKAIDHTAQAQESYTLTFYGLGCYPNLSKPRILWIGLKNQDELRLTYNRLIRNIRPIVQLDRPRFTPHVTIARIKDTIAHFSLVQLNEMVQDNQQQIFGSMTLEKLALIESDLFPTGPVYHLIHQSVLKLKKQTQIEVKTGTN